MDKTAKGESRSFTVFDRSHVPPNFLENKLDKLNVIIQRLDTEISTQESVNQVYESFATTVLGEMKDKLHHRKIHITDGINNKKRRTKKPWWTSELTNLWNDLCKSEKHMLRSNGQSKEIKKRYFQRKEEIFDKTLQRETRKYWHERQSE